MRLDMKDKRILYELGNDARISYSNLARKIGLSREVVKYRIENLIKNKVILFFTTFINTNKTEVNTYQFYIQLEKTTHEDEVKIIEFLNNHEMINYLCSCSGMWDLMCECYAKNVLELRELINEIMSKFNKNIKKIDTTIILNEYVCLNKSILEGRRGGELEHLRFATNQIKLDETEKKILYLLTHNCRMNYVDIANKVKVSTDVVKYKIKKLINEEIIIGFKVIYDLFKLGFQQHIILYQLQTTKEQEKRFMYYLKEHPNIIYAIQSIGNWDISVVVNVRNNEEFRNVLIDIRNKFTDIIKNETALLLHKEFKNHYLAR